MRQSPLLLLLATLFTLGPSLFSPGSEPLRDRDANPAVIRTQGSGEMPPGFDHDVASVVAEIDRIEADALRRMNQTTLDRQGQIHTLGKLLLFDKHLSVYQNEACSFCHTPETGFTGPIQSLNLSTVSYPGSVRT